MPTTPSLHHFPTNNQSPSSRANATWAGPLPDPWHCCPPLPPHSRRQPKQFTLDLFLVSYCELCCVARVLVLNTTSIAKKTFVGMEPFHRNCYKCTRIYVLFSSMSMDFHLASHFFLTAIQNFPTLKMLYNIIVAERTAIR